MLFSKKRLFVFSLLSVASLVGVQTSALAADETSVDSVLSRVFTNYSINDDLKKSGFSVETIQPLFMDEQHTFFFQGRAAYKDHDWTLNSGLGYRYLLSDQSWLLGANAWWDGTTKRDHRRWGLGVEAIGQVITLRGNYYNAYSGWKKVTTDIEEKALDGFDAEAEGQVPYLPWARIGLGYYKWKGIEKDDINGFRGRVQMDLTDYTRFEVGHERDSENTSTYFKLSVALGAPREVQYSALRTGFTSQSAFNNRDLNAMRLTRVKRSHDIVVERRSVTGVFKGITVGRGN